MPHFRDPVARTDIPGLFDEVLGAVVGPAVGRWLKFCASFLLRRMHSDEETAELRGISTHIGVAMRVLVAFNVLLDLLLGCTSGGIPRR